MAVIVGVSRYRPWAAKYFDRSICLGDLGDLGWDVRCFLVVGISCQLFSHNYSESTLVLFCFWYLEYLIDHECA